MDLLRKRSNPFEKKETREIDSEETQIMKDGNFNKYDISDITSETLISNGFKYLFPIQQKTFKHIYSGKDIIGRDRTGSGKTLAFALPSLERLRRKDKYFRQKRGQKPFVLVLVPTRELAIQVTKEFEKLINTPKEFRVLSVYGGTDIYRQIDQLKDGVEVIVGTPGRLMDLQERRKLDLGKVKCIILDETDQMLNFGFQEDIEKILKNAKEDLKEREREMEDVQFLLFSATVPRWVEKIAAKFMDPDLVRVDMVKNENIKTSVTVEHLCIFFPNKDQKIATIGDVVKIYGGSHCRTIIFTDTKQEANDIMLDGQLKMDMQVLHGGIPQNQREVTFKSFRAGTLKCLVATNVAARGLDIPEVDLIIQLSPPKEIDAYIHRSGRTGRAGKSGVCITFYSNRQKELIDRIEYKIGVTMKKVGVPQPKDLIKASARDIATSFDKVSKDILIHFTESAKDILEHYSPEEALKRALAIMSGYTKGMKQRSLLFSMEGYITYVIENDREIRSLSYVWGILKRNFSPDLVESIKGMRMLKNRMGSVFDVSENYKEEFDKDIQEMRDSYVKIYVAKVLPEIEERDSNRGNYQRDGRGQSRGYNDRGNGFRNDRGRLNDDIDECKLYITNLGDTKEYELEDYVEDNGFRPDDVYLVKGADGQSRGFGYVKFKDPSTAKDALRSLSQKRLNNKQPRVSFAFKKRGF